MKQKKYHFVNAKYFNNKQTNLENENQFFQQLTIQINIQYDEKLQFI